MADEKTIQEEFQKRRSSATQRYKADVAKYRGDKGYAQYLQRRNKMYDRELKALSREEQRQLTVARGGTRAQANAAMRAAEDVAGRSQRAKAAREIQRVEARGGLAEGERYSRSARYLKRQEISRAGTSSLSLTKKETQERRQGFTAAQSRAEQAEKIRQTSKLANRIEANLRLQQEARRIEKEQKQREPNPIQAIRPKSQIAPYIEFGASTAPATFYTESIINTIPLTKERKLAVLASKPGDLATESVIITPLDIGASKLSQERQKTIALAEKLGDKKTAALIRGSAVVTDPIIKTSQRTATGVKVYLDTEAKYTQKTGVPQFLSKKAEQLKTKSTQQFLSVARDTGTKNKALDIAIRGVRFAKASTTRQTAELVDIGAMAAKRPATTALTLYVGGAAIKGAQTAGTSLITKAAPTVSRAAASRISAAAVFGGLSSANVAFAENKSQALGSELAGGFLFVGAGKSLKYSRRGAVAFGAKEVRAESLFAEEVLAGKKTFPTTTSGASALKEFESAKLPSGRYMVAHASPKPVRGEVIGAGPAGARNLEDVGLYVTPSGRGSPYFLGVQQGKAEYEFGLLPRFKRPSLQEFEVVSVERQPSQSLRSVGFKSTNVYLQSQAPTGKAFITKRSELGQTSELEAVIPKGTKIQSLKPSSGIGRLKGYQEYTVVGGEAVPIRRYQTVPSQTVSESEFNKVTGNIRKGSSDLSSSITTRRSSLAPSSYSGLISRKKVGMTTSKLPKYSTSSSVSTTSTYTAPKSSSLLDFSSSLVSSSSLKYPTSTYITPPPSYTYSPTRYKETPVPTVSTPRIPTSKVRPPTNVYYRPKPMVVRRSTTIYRAFPEKAGKPLTPKFNIGGIVGRKKSKQKKSSLTKYFPSLVAGEYKIKTTKKKLEEDLYYRTGIGIRPILI